MTPFLFRVQQSEKLRERDSVFPETDANPLWISPNGYTNEITILFRPELRLKRGWGFVCVKEREEEKKEARFEKQVLCKNHILTTLWHPVKAIIP